MLPDSTIITVALSIFFPASVPNTIQSKGAEQPQAVTNTNSRTGNQTEGNMSGASLPQFKSL